MDLDDTRLRRVYHRLFRLAAEALRTQSDTERGPKPAIHDRDNDSRNAGE